MYRTILCLGLALAGAAHAGEKTPSNVEFLSTFAEDTGDVVRIESAEYLRTYSQEVAAAACFLYNDIDPTLSRELLREARKGFDLRVDALLNGNPALGIIGGEERRKTIVKIEEVAAMWQDMAAAVDALLADNGDAAAVGVIKAQNMALFEKTDILVTEVEAQYSNPSVLTQANALVLEIVGRQAMMTQKIAKNACKVFTGVGTDEVIAELQSSKQIYEISLDALLNGMPELGIQPAPTAEIADALIRVQSDWKTVRPIMDRLVEGEAVDRDTQVFLFKHMVEEMVRLEDISHAFVEFSRYDS